MDNDFLSRDIPSNVHMEKLKEKKKPIRQEIDEVDAYEEPTELFQWINYGNYEGAILRAKEHPNEVKIWIVSYHDSKAKGWKQEIKWRYLPLHLVCLKGNSSESEELLDALLSSYPKGAKEKDYNSNLPIHNLLSEGCVKLEVIKKLQRAYPESIDVRDGKGRSLLEIVSESYQSGKINKDSMISVLAFLRQWAIKEGQIKSKTTRNVHGSGSKKQSRRNFQSRSTKPPGNKERKTKRLVKGGIMKSESYDDAINMVSVQETISNNNSFDCLEMRPENTITERDSLRKTVSKLKSEVKNHDSSMVKLKEQFEKTSSDQQRMKERLKQKKERIEELRLLVQKQEARMKKQEDIFNEKEKRIAEKDREINEMNIHLSKVTEENDQIRYGNLHYQGDIDRVKRHLEEVRNENIELKQRIEKCQKIKLEAEEEAKTNEKAYQERIYKLETQIEELSSEDRNAQVIRAEEREIRLRSRISSLENELVEALAKDYDGRLSNLPNFVLVEEEREALQKMNASIQEHVGSLKERCKQLEETDAINEGLRMSVEQLEKDLEEARLKQTEYREELDSFRSDSLIKESKLQTQLAKVERDLLEEKSKNHTNISENSEQPKLEEELHAAQLLNSSSQGHITILQEKCKVLEGNLEQAKRENDSLCKEILSVKLNTVTEREKEISFDFQQLLSTIKDLSASGGDGVGSETLSILQTENDSLRKKINSLTSLQSENNSLRKKLNNFKLLQGENASLRGENKSLHEEIEKLRSRNSDAQAEILNKEEEMELLLREATNLKARNSDLEAEIVHLNTEIESLQRESADQRSRNSNEEKKMKSLQTEIDELTIAMQKIKIEKERSDKDHLLLVGKLEADKNELETQNEELVHKQHQSGRETLDLINQLQEENRSIRSQSDEFSHAANRFQDQLVKSKEEYEQVKRKNKELRDLISRNNGTYIKEVNSLGKELKEIRSVNTSLHAHVLDLSTENEKLRNGKSYEPVKIEQYKEKVNEMTMRLNEIAGYLIAVALFVDGEDNGGGSGLQHTDGVNAEIDGQVSKKTNRKDEILAEMARRQENILSSEERDDILRNVNRYEHDFRSDTHDSFNFLRQREGLNSIAVSLQKLMEQ
mmetsp:Transcript_25374/g.38475  ORF Transcript_25374/g.38475 Transcript_25374/m.38475 type:complete len:1113 (+) Transcript_25374:121-3459(+)|eukprot:CAMPEP_0178929776 /NCGR_PEP_ID=MMETSP0786-20121207/20826_1 /TAXON_ID=186022 /ORGANISM="Thalassionema frauenfeldii, Strain CCMP 1798" /LENGTH=1112 /DNA_ID=CAMNT_0020606147 /DNA_START=47 /DNA_END=3385 /DNA_ORIENTATION=+